MWNPTGPRGFGRLTWALALRLYGLQSHPPCRGAIAPRGLAPPRRAFFTVSTSPPGGSALTFSHVLEPSTPFCHYFNFGVIRRQRIGGASSKTAATDAPDSGPSSWHQTVGAVGGDGDRPEWFSHASSDLYRTIVRMNEPRGGFVAPARRISSEQERKRSRGEISTLAEVARAALAWTSVMEARSEPSERSLRGVYKGGNHRSSSSASGTTVPAAAVAPRSRRARTPSRKESRELRRRTRRRPGLICRTRGRAWHTSTVPPMPASSTSRSRSPIEVGRCARPGSSARIRCTPPQPFTTLTVGQPWGSTASGRAVYI
jgi:hypothetical protein